MATPTANPMAQAGAKFGTVLGITIHTILWGLAGLAAFASAIEFFFSIPESASQQGAIGALSAARVVIAYVAARTWDELALRWLVRE